MNTSLMSTRLALLTLGIAAAVLQQTATPGWAAKSKPPSTHSADNVTKATTLVKNVLTGNYTAAAATFDAPVKARLNAATLKSMMDSLLGQVGKFEKILGNRQEKYQNYNIVFVGTKFELAELTFKCVYAPNGLVGGFFAMPGWTPPLPEVKPTPTQAAQFDEKAVTVGSGEWALPGTLTMPKGKGLYPAVVLVHGSGPDDRNESIGRNKPFRDLAWGLAAKGIAVLRYDKRTLVHGAKMVQKGNLTVKEETIDDAVSAVELLKKTPGIKPDKIFVLGHSLGAMLAPKIGVADPDIAGLIIMAGNTRPLEDLLVEQIRYIGSVSGPLTDALQKKLDSLQKETDEQAKKIKELTQTSTVGPKDLPAGTTKEYWLSLKDYKPEKVAADITRPMFIMQGERDYQVTVRDFEGWKHELASKPNVTFKLYDKLNHLFIEGTGKSKPAEYEEPGHVAPYVIDDIAAFINK